MIPLWKSDNINNNNNNDNPQNLDHLIMICSGASVHFKRPIYP
jgi:hypothetical protein